MKQPDRFARLVGQHRHIACDGMGYILLEETARHLMRLEHRAVVRLVKRAVANKAIVGSGLISRMDLLAALAKRAR